MGALGLGGVHDSKMAKDETPDLSAARSCRRRAIGNGGRLGLSRVDRVEIDLQAKQKGGGEGGRMVGDAVRGDQAGRW